MAFVHRKKPMLESKVIKEHLLRAVCYKCGGSLEHAKLFTISDAPMVFMAHTVCPKCNSESVFTITAAGSGTMPLISDLTGEEITKFAFDCNVNYDDLFDLYKKLMKKSLWNLLRKKEKNSVKKHKV
jgi:hypothetical protein